MGKHLYNDDRPAEVVAFFEKARSVIDKEEEGREVEEKPKSNKLYKKKYPLVILPTLERYASDIGSSPRVLQDWKEIHPEFNEAVEICMAIQREMLVQLSLNNHYNQSIVKLILTNCHGFRNKVEVEGTGGVTIHIDSEDEKA